MPQQIANIPASNVAGYITGLAAQHGVTYVKTPLDELAQVITRLADDEVSTDATEDLIVALKRAHVIDVNTMVVLLGRHLDERLHV
jgi:hypothetical protein